MTSTTTAITLPTPVLEAEFTRRQNADDTAALLGTLGDAIARQAVLESLALIRSTHQGASVVTEAAKAADAREDADNAHLDRTTELSEVHQMAQEIRARDTAIEILAGMVATLIAEK
ncbi:hypothetical protein ABZV65_19610 [Streptomyces bauhiniae]|uniref:hypothetical protein n=1 Tax=Streptomyces bauhiniae TaxID=2340725 RepID=UPI0033A4C8CB